MRGVHLADLEWVTRVLLAVPAAQRADLLEEMLITATRGDQFYQLTGRAHPLHGIGTLMSAASRLKMVPRPAVLTPDYLRCLAMIALRIGDQSS
ncbi:MULTISPECIES: hypothetical protein [unclassified Yoonia]|uniref:DUF7742 family protein n=1 Tax=unclassified Yoonia TaxID=2629118 RepID=UPI002AFED8C2|nr:MULTISPECIES: hypothetical protein [unclassified Yoonia]